MISQPRSHSDDGDNTDDLTSLLTVIPNQGTLAAGETTQLYFKFSPRFQRSNIGWKSSEELPPRKDYALFINIEAVGIINKSDEGVFKHGTSSPFKTSSFCVEPYLDALGSGSVRLLL